MKPYEPPGYIGVIYAIQLIAKSSEPDLWRSDAISMKETIIWNGLFGMFGDLDPSILSEHLNAQLPKFETGTFERYLSFIDAQVLLRDSLCLNKLIASYRDENGSENQIPPARWSSVHGDEMISKGVGYFDENTPNIEVCRYVFIKEKDIVFIINELKTTSNAKYIDSSIPTISGGAGRPTSMHLILNEAERRCAAGDVPNSQAAFAANLSAWLRETHPTAAQAQAKSIQNNAAFRSLYNEHNAARRAS